MTEHLTTLEILGLAGSISLLAGWRLYLCILATGIAMRFGVLPLPDHLQSLQVLANPWVMGAATVALAAVAFVGWRAEAPEGWNVLVFGVILTIYTLVSGGLFRSRGGREAVAQ